MRERDGEAECLKQHERPRRRPSESREGTWRRVRGQAPAERCGGVCGCAKHLTRRFGRRLHGCDNEALGPGGSAGGRRGVRGTLLRGTMAERTEAGREGLCV